MKNKSNYVAPLGHHGMAVLNAAKNGLEELGFLEAEWHWEGASVFAGGAPMRVPVELDGAMYQLHLKKGNCCIISDTTKQKTKLRLFDKPGDPYT